MCSLSLYLQSAAVSKHLPLCQAMHMHTATEIGLNSVIWDKSVSLLAKRFLKLLGKNLMHSVVDAVALLLLFSSSLPSSGQVTSDISNPCSNDGGGLWTFEFSVLS